MSDLDADALRARIAASPYHKANGITLDEVEPGRSLVRMEIAAEHLNPQGVVHGGVIAGLLDSAAGTCLRSLLAENAEQRTVQLQVTYLRAATAGILLGEATAVHSGRRMSYAEAEVRDEEGNILARGTATFLNL